MSLSGGLSDVALLSPLWGYVIGAGRTISGCEPLPCTTGGLCLEAKLTECTFQLPRHCTNICRLIEAF